MERMKKHCVEMIGIIAKPFEEGVEAHHKRWPSLLLKPDGRRNPVKTKGKPLPPRLPVLPGDRLITSCRMFLKVDLPSSRLRRWESYR